MVRPSNAISRHVDRTTTLLALAGITPDAPEIGWRLRIQPPEAPSRYVVPQGSLTIENNSLTVASVANNIVEIAIIPHSYAATSLRILIAVSLSPSRSMSSANMSSANHIPP